MFGGRKINPRQVAFARRDGHTGKELEQPFPKPRDGQTATAAPNRLTRAARTLSEEERCALLASIDRQLAELDRRLRPA
jgi:hypothetical protein